jgi:hypothetical protein
MPKYMFGKNSSRSNAQYITADNIELAIKIFNIQELYPEKYVSSKYIKESDYNSALNRYEYVFKKDPKISIHIRYEDSNKKDKFVKEILLSECINVSYNTNRTTHLIEYTSDEKEIEEQKEEKFDIEQAKQLTKINVENKDITQYNKTELRTINDTILYKMKELEQTRYELSVMKRQLEKELNQKVKMLFILETYMGINESVYQLKKGTTADKDEPLSLYQLKLYMDEEIGLWGDEYEGGIDLNSIEEFDKWIIENNRYKKFLYKEQSVCTWQVRRKEKKYSENPFENSLYNQGNFNTYFLIRNGENVYRIWSGVHITEKMFPVIDEYEKILKSESISSWAEDKIKEKHEQYMYGLIAIQGLIERSQIFNEKIKKVNLLKSNGFTDKEINLIRDAEPGTFVTDGKLSWENFLQKHSKNVSLGSRVVITQQYFYNSKEEERWRTYPFYFNRPSNTELYIVEKTKESHPDFMKCYRNSPSFAIYFQSDYYWGDNENPNRKPFRLYENEVINFDTVTIEELEYYERNRLDRSNYLSMLPVIHWMKNLKKEERKLEDEFIKFITGKTEGKYEAEEIRKVIRWWKLKNKWKRDILSDESKAVRMVLKKLKKEEK